MLTHKILERIYCYQVTIFHAILELNPIPFVLYLILILFDHGGLGFPIYNIYPDRSIVLMPTPTVNVTNHSQRSMYNHPIVINARVYATAYISSAFTLSQAELRLLSSNTYLFLAIHHRLAGQYFYSLTSLLKVDLFTLTQYQMRPFFSQ